MPNPFPGMDPYLEDPAHWPGVHNLFMGEIVGALNSRLRPAYYADLEDRVYISGEDDTGRKVIIPDVRILPAKGGKKVPKQSPKNPPAAIVCQPVEVTTLIDDETRETYVTIVERVSRQVVTVIEVLSPTNKTGGARGRDSYMTKRTEVMRSGTNWVEIDLLRDGEPIIVRELYPECEYTVHVSRKSGRPKGYVWQIRLQQRLPEIPIPLRGDDPDVPLDLQPLLAAVYERGAYDLKLDYAADPVPPLPADLAKWANKLLKQKKLR
jgi:hypothetical protein